MTSKLSQVKGCSYDIQLLIYMHYGAQVYVIAISSHTVIIQRYDVKSENSVSKFLD